MQAKILVFASTCKQVKFLYEAFSRLRPGCPLRSLHGGMKQMRRMSVFYDFCKVTCTPTLPPWGRCSAWTFSIECCMLPISLSLW